MAIKTAMRAGDLDDANKIDAVKKAVQGAEARRRSIEEKAKAEIERKQRDADERDARRIVFVCDASGSMLNKMATLKNALEKAVGGLQPVQSFNIIFFQDQKCIALDKVQLVAATAENRRNAYKFLDDVTTSGTTDPIPGLTLAFQQHPQLVYLVADGDFPDNKAVKAKIAELNHGALFVVAPHL